MGWAGSIEGLVRGRGRCWTSCGGDGGFLCGLRGGGGSCICVCIYVRVRMHRVWSTLAQEWSFARCVFPVVVWINALCVIIPVVLTG